MLADFFLFPLYAFVLLSIGFGFFRLVARTARFEVPVHQPGIVLLMGQFCIGCIALAANFFVGVAHPFVCLAIIVFFVLGLPWAARCTRKDLLLMLGLSALLVPLVAFMPAGYDAGLYHLPHQLWLREEKIVFGLANFHGRFGFGSFQEYISAPQWIGEHFKLHAYAKATYFIAFLMFLWQWSSLRKHHFVLLAFLTAITFLLFYLMGITKYIFWWDYGFTDSQAGFLFTMAFLYGVGLLHSATRKDAVLDEHVFVFSFLSLFAVMMKLSSILVLAWTACVYIILVSTKAVSLPRAIVPNILPLAALILFLVKNLIVSGCLFYPAAGSCLDVAWSARANAQGDSGWITAWARHPGSGLYSLESSAWLKNFWLPEYGAFCMKMLLITVLLAACSLIIHRLRKVAFSLDRIKMLGMVFLLLVLSFWFINAPAPRFGLGVFLTLPSFLAFVLLGEPAENEKYAERCKIMAKAVIIVLGVLLGGWNAKNISVDRWMGFDPLGVVSPAIVQDKVFGVRPKGSDQCWVVPYCSPYSRSAPEKRSGYLFFPPAQDQE
ncbi:MAG TPA: hypothetical protein ENN39_00030 [Desulfonatronum sp.]|nr:hypothetical protein [Desulfonatronum sp.]